MLTEKFLNSAGTKLHYIDWGGHGRPLVLLAGLGGTAHIFRGLGSRLAERFRVLALTRRGHGRSDRPDTGYELDTLVDDIARFLDAVGIDAGVLVGHSWAGIEIPRFATRYADRVEATIYLDALHQLLEPHPDLGKDPVWAHLQTRPKPEDLVSCDSYLAYRKRSRPDLARIWCEAIETDLLEDVTIENGRPVDDRHGSVVSTKMLAGLGPYRDPAYRDVMAPALAFVRTGITNPLVPEDASGELERAANAYYVESFLPWIERGTSLFREAVPDASIVDLDTSNHLTFIAKEDETVEGMYGFLANLGI